MNATTINSYEPIPIPYATFRFVPGDMSREKSLIDEEYFTETHCNSKDENWSDDDSLTDDDDEVQLMYAGANELEMMYVGIRQIELIRSRIREATLIRDQMNDTLHGV